ncbi:hypothetical protein LCGC14_2831540, partial [marine sediment metagenome]
VKIALQKEKTIQNLTGMVTGRDGEGITNIKFKYFLNNQIIYILFQ